MTITDTHFNYYQLCHRKLWLFANGINMEQESELVQLCLVFTCLQEDYVVNVFQQIVAL